MQHTIYRIIFSSIKYRISLRNNSLMINFFEVVYIQKNISNRFITIHRSMCFLINMIVLFCLLNRRQHLTFSYYVICIIHNVYNCKCHAFKVNIILSCILFKYYYSSKLNCIHFPTILNSIILSNMPLHTYFFIYNLRNNYLF